MPELTHDTTDDGFHEIQLSGKQLVFLFMATTVASVVIFLFGVHIGRSVGADRTAEQPIDSSAPETASTPYTAAPPATGAEAPAPVADTDLSYHQRLQDDARKEEIKPPAEQPQAVPKPLPPAEAKAQTPPAPAPQTAGASVPTSGRPGTWFLQVAALRNRAVAADTVRRLINKGYPAFLENPAAGVPAIYRVRIGRYGSREEADQVARRLQKEEQFTSDIRRY